MAKFSDHARERMEQRGVFDEDVERALARPLGAPLSGKGGTMWIRGHAPGGRILKVLVRAAEPDYVVTVAWEENR